MKLESINNIDNNADGFVNFIRDKINASINELLLHQDIYSRKYELNISSLKFAIEQILIRQKNEKKFNKLLLLDKPYFIFPSPISAEQASSELAAEYKSKIIKNYSTSIDLTGGLGIDSIYFAKNSKKHIYNEQNKFYCDTFGCNVKTLNINNIEIYNNDAEELLKNKTDPKIDLIYIDPSRRDDDNNKHIVLELLLPNIISLQEQLSNVCNNAIIKLSPMFDISEAIRNISNVSEIHIVAINNECKELLIVTDYKNKIAQIKYVAANLNYSNNAEIFEYDASIDCDEINYSLPQKYIYEPNTAIMKLQCWEVVSKKYALSKLHKNTHLWTSNKIINDFQGRKFELQAFYSYSNRGIKAITPGLEKANITCRNFPFTVQKVRKILKVKEGGDLYLFATTLVNNGLTILICKKI